MRLRTLFLVIVLLPWAPASGQEPDPAAEESAGARAIDRGLTWLAGEQAKSGAWRAAVGMKRNDDYVRTGVGPVEHPGVSALATLAFLAAGATPGEGRNGECLAAGLTYLASVTDDDGMITANGTRMHSHGVALAVLALAERMHPDEARAQLVRRAAGFTAKAQNAAGGWRYAPFDLQSDLVVTSGQILALLEARDAGARVPQFVIDRGITYVLRSVETDPGTHEGMLRYVEAVPSRYTHALTAAGLHCLLRAGLDTDEAIADFVAANEVRHLAEEGRTPRIKPILHAVRDLPSSPPPVSFQWFYGSFHAARALSILGGEKSDEWRARARTVLVEGQWEDGSWPAAGIGNAFGTAIATTILLLPKGHLPANPR